MKTALRRVLLFFLSALILISCASFGLLGSRQVWRPPHPVVMKAGTSEMMCWCNMIPSRMTLTVSSERFTGGLLVRDGDIVDGGNFSSARNNMFVYKQSDGASLEMREEDGRLILSGMTISIAPADIEGCWEWLDQASANDLRSLRFLMLPKNLDESRLPALRKLAAVNPDLNLGILGLEIGPSTNSMSAVALFKPRVLFLESSVSAAELSGFLAGQNQIETLFITVTDAENLDFLATLPNLRRLAIDGWDPATTGLLPKEMRALKSLLLSHSGILDASAFAAVPEGIQELSLVMCGIASRSGLERFSNLRTLILSASEGIEDLSVLRGMKKLAWVGLPPGITQEQFSAFIGEHPAMKIVELIGCGEITDLSPLQRLTGLTGLVVGQIGGKFAAVDQVDQLKSLEFLGLTGEVFDKDPESLARIREALPRALVVPVCLGSGWILLVIPLAALMWIAGSWARSRRRTSPQHGILCGGGKQR